MEGWGTGMKSRAFAPKLTHPIVRGDLEAQLSAPAVARRCLSRMVLTRQGSWVASRSAVVPQVARLPQRSLTSRDPALGSGISCAQPCLWCSACRRPHTAVLSVSLCLPFVPVCSTLASLIIFVIKMYLFMSFVHCVHYLYCQVFVLLVFFPPLSFSPVCISQGVISVPRSLSCLSFVCNGWASQIFMEINQERMNDVTHAGSSECQIGVGLRKSGSREPYSSKQSVSGDGLWHEMIPDTIGGTT